MALLSRLFVFTRRVFSMAGDGQKYNVVFVLGGPGAGKGTQCQKIEEVKWQFFLLSVEFMPFVGEGGGRGGQYLHHITYRLVLSFLWNLERERERERSNEI